MIYCLLYEAPWMLSFSRVVSLSNLINQFLFCLSTFIFLKKMHYNLLSDWKSSSVLLVLVGLYLFYFFTLILVGFLRGIVCYFNQKALSLLKKLFYSSIIDMQHCISLGCTVCWFDGFMQLTLEQHRDWALTFCSWKSTYNFIVSPPYPWFSHICGSRSRVQLTPD